jgi:hypothetical protein
VKGNKNMKQKIKLGIILGIEFIAITVILILIFFAGKKTYKVTFDLNGGTLISGELVQEVMQGKNATPPSVAKDGCYLRSWSASYKQVTHDIVVKAVWEWEIITTVGFEYSSTENKDYCTIDGSFEDLYGDVYVPVHHGNMKILGISDGAFANRHGITKVHMLDGIISIGKNAFANCSELVSVELPGTLKKLGEGAFENCAKLTTVVFPDDLEVIPANAFKNCTALKEIVIPASVKTISAGAFVGCTSLEKIVFETEEITEYDEETEENIVIGYNGLEYIVTGAFIDCDSLTEIILPETVKDVEAFAFNNSELTIRLPFEEDDIPDGFAENWNGESLVEWGYSAPETEETQKKRG